MKKQYDYEADWGAYVYPTSHSHIASTDELIQLFGTTDAGCRNVSAAGIPLYTDKDRIIVNNETENTIIFGETGSKKTRCVIRPLMYSLIAKGESMFVTDPKGELATDAKLRGYLDERGYRTVFLDFRDFLGDSCNIFDNAIQLYREGKKEKAVEAAGAIIHMLVEKGASAKNDPFWATTSEELCVPIVHLLLELYAEDNPEKINMGSIGNLINEDGIDCLESLISDSALSDAPLRDVHNASLTMLRGAISGSEKTTANIIVSAFAVLQPFLYNEALLRMTSLTSFDVSEMYEKPTAVFLIVPDERSTYDRIAGILLDNFYCRLIEIFTNRYQHRKTPVCRVNFVCDEFCNVAINDMGPKISACRSREIRFFLVCQSLSQLRQMYPDDASIIIGNCRNLLFLSSSDPELLSYVSDLCGTTNITASGQPEPLVSVEMLRRLGKDSDFKEAVFVRDDFVYRAKLSDCDAPVYDYLKRYFSEKPVPITKKAMRKPDTVSVRQFKQDITKCSEKLFSELRDPKNELSEAERLKENEAIQAELDRKFNELFGSDSRNKKTDSGKKENNS